MRWGWWRELPCVVVAIFGRGESRWEESNGLFHIRAENDPIFFYRPSAVYLSSIQYWCRWSFQVQWPLFIAFHYYFKNRVYSTSKGTNGKLFYLYWGAKRDSDRVYWFPAFYIGLNWK